jgi:hypothetical protein
MELPVLLFSILLIALQSTESNDTGAFCRPSGEYRLFPFEVPDGFTPWPFDAIFVEEMGYVEITTIAPPKRACDFNVTQWIKAVAAFPQHKQRLADGSLTNILVDTSDANAVQLAINDITRKQRKMTGPQKRNAMADVEDWHLMLGERLTCEYFDATGNSLATTSSDVIYGDPTWLGYGTVQIICPAPPSNVARFSIMRLHRDLARLRAHHAEYTKIDLLPASTRGSTPSFPVCNFSELRQKFAQHRMSKMAMARKKKVQYEFDMAICTATGRADRERLVEWIEYYRLLGVEHFFIYDTAPMPAPATATASGSSPQKLDNVLSDYVSEGIATVIPWKVRAVARQRYKLCAWCLVVVYLLSLRPSRNTELTLTLLLIVLNPWQYENCVRGMAHGRSISWVDGEGTREHFYPPKRISQSSALSSCYSRYRGMARFILAVDDDEFITLSEHNWDYFSEEVQHDEIKAADEPPRKREKKQQRKRLVRSLFNYAQWVFHANKEYAALRFQPIIKHQCWEEPSARSGLAVTVTPPRVGRWPAGEVGKSFEGKLLVRTDAIQNFYVHYVSQLLHRSRHRNSTANNHKSARKQRDTDSHHIKNEPLDVGINEAAVLHYKLPYNESGDIFSRRRTDVAAAACDAHRRWAASAASAASTAASAQRKRGNADGVLGAAKTVDRSVVTEPPPPLQTKLNENFQSRLKRNDELR